MESGFCESVSECLIVNFASFCTMVEAIVDLKTCILYRESEIDAGVARWLVSQRQCDSRMFKIDTCSWVLAFISIRLVFRRSVLHFHRHKAYPFGLVHNKDFEVWTLWPWMWGEVLCGFSYLSGFSHFFVQLYEFMLF